MFNVLRILVVYFLLVNSLVLAGDVEAPLPYDSESPASPACIGKLQTFYDIFNALFVGVPSSSTMKRNDVIVPFIQTSSVFTPLATGTKTVKYRVTGSYIQNSTNTFKSYIENNDGDMSIRVFFKSSADWSIYLGGKFDDDCSGNADIASSRGVSAQKWVENGLYGYIYFSGETQTDELCADKTKTFYAKITEMDVSKISCSDHSTSPSVECNNTQRESIRAEVLARINSATTLNDLCSFWGL